MEKLEKNVVEIVVGKVALDMILFLVGCITGKMIIAAIGFIDLLIGTGIEIQIWFLIGMIYFKIKEKKARK